ncbi:MAG: helix-turn-helix transcriptional regulator [Treponema sp.]|nr:helix-turn-helix transcriptional regulator [Treponema sp.]
MAGNIKERRRKYGFSQEKLAEKAGLSPQYIAMIELSRKFPSPEVLDRIAGVLNIETYQLFAVAPSPDDTIERLRQVIRDDIRQVFGELVEKAVTEKCKSSNA